MTTRPYDHEIACQLAQHLARLEGVLRSEVMMAGLIACGGVAPHILDGMRAVFEGRVVWRDGTISNSDSHQRP